jgi:uncharacterized delta-60 repeat protein
MKLKLIAGLLICGLSALYPQAVQQWLNRYNGPVSGSDAAFAVATDNSGNVFVTGNIANITERRTDIATIKYNSSGIQQWVKIFNGESSGLDYGRDIAVDDSGNVYVTGESAGASNYNCVTIKYNTNGDSLWAAVRTNGYGRRIKIDSLGFIYIVGYTATPSFNDILIIKYNSSGNEIWSKTYDGPGQGPDFGKGIDVDAVGNVYVTGTVYNGLSAIVTLKYSSAGTMLWDSLYASTVTGYDDAADIVVDDLGNVYVCGSTGSPAIGKTFTTLMYAQDGTLEWVDKYTLGSGNAYKFTKKNGDVYAAGYYQSTSTGNDYVVARYSSSGRIWLSTYNGYLGSDIAYNLIADNNQNVYVTGGSVGQSSAWEDYGTVKFDSDGMIKWVARYNGPGNGLDVSYGIALDNEGNVIVCGSSLDSVSEDYVTIKYSQLTGTAPNGTKLADDYNLFNNYPNPFNPTTKLSFVIGNSSFVSLKVYDVLGDEVATLVNEEKPAGKYEMDFDASSLPSSVYFYQLRAGNFIQTKKMILLR